LTELAQRPDAVGLALLSDPEIQELNRRYRGSDRPTDVLSFPAGAAAIDGENDLGDIAIGLGVASRQARARRHPLHSELCRLLLHGLLHLLGYDHEADAGQMAALERSLWRRLQKSR
jgi:probable rRNA maturation factor